MVTCWSSIKIRLVSIWTLLSLHWHRNAKLKLKFGRSRLLCFSVTIQKDVCKQPLEPIFKKQVDIKCLVASLPCCAHGK